MPEPGWYDDPTGESPQRWWDGERWTEHVSGTSAPAAPPAPTPPPPGPGADPGATMAAPLPPSAPAPAPGFPTAAPAAASSGGGSKAPLLILGAVVLVIAIAGIAAVLLSGGGGSSSVGIDPGHRVDLSVESDGRWEYEFEAPAGTLVIDVRGDGGFDPVAYLEDASGRELAMNDDRSVEHLEEYGGDWLDSLIEIDVAEGSYRLIVEEWSGQPGTGQALFPVVGG